MNTIAIRKPNQHEEERKQVCLEQLVQDRHALLLHWPFIGSVIMRMELIPVRDDRLTSACTDGDNIFIDINFYSKLNNSERLFVLAHEVWHSVLLHFVRRQKRDIVLFNMAADLEIHFALKKELSKKNERMSEPFVLPHDPAWDGLSAEEIYEKLRSIMKQQNGPGGRRMSIPAWCNKYGEPGTTNPKFGNGQSGFDKHIFKGDAIPSPETLAPPNAQNDDGAPQNSDTSQTHQGQQNGKNGGNSKVEEDGELGTASNPAVIDPDYSPNVSNEAVERSRSRTIAAAQQMERTQGLLPAHIKALIDKLQKPSLPWQEMLKQFVTTCYGGKRRWLPPARRHIWQDIYLPSMRAETLKAVVALDTSGSTERDLPIFFAELVSLMKSFGKFALDVIQCDAEIQQVEHYTDEAVPPPNKKWKVKGLGGTDFRPVFEYIRKNMHEQPDLLLFFTDGFGTAPANRPPYPVMWVLTSDGTVPATWGRVAHFKKEERR